MKNIMIAAVYLLLLFAMRVGAEAVADELMSILLLMGVIFLMGPGIIFGLYALVSGRLQPTRPALLCRAMPLALILTGMALVIAIPFTQIFAENRHERVKAQWMQVVSAIERQALMPDEQGRVHLPEKWRALSRFDEAMVYELSPQRSVIGFWVSKVPPDVGATVICCSDAQPPDRQTLQAEQISICKALGEGWYYVVYE